MNNKKIAINISRWVLAILFIFSGLAKSVNPFGFSVQVGEYLNFMGLSPLKPLASLAGVVLPSLELLLGIMLAMGLSRKIAAWGVTLFMTFFTLLTLWIALTNPVNDCGCFGEVLKLTNWQTFIKNILMLPFVGVLFYNYCLGKSPVPRSRNYRYIIAIPLSFILAIYCNFNLPVIETTPYKKGTNIAGAMSVPDGAKKAEIETVLIYKNRQNGEVKNFQITDTTWHDESKWEYVDTQTTTIDPGYTPPIKNLPMIDLMGEDHAADVLATQGRLLIVVTNDLVESDVPLISEFARANTIHRLVVLTSSPIPETNIEIYNSDHTVISTMIQNRTGGALLLENGVITQKYVMREITVK